MSDATPVLRRPPELLDPDGEGIYVLSLGDPDARSWPSPLTWAAYLLGVHWRELDREYVWMREDDDGYWHRVDSPAWWRFYRRKWLPAQYIYCTARPDAQ